MAWNPSPEVAVARDAAKRLGEIYGASVRQVVVMFITDDGRFGYASYGATKAECGEARKLGNVMYDAAENYLSRT